MDLSGSMYAPIETDPWIVDEAEEYGSSQGSSRSQQMVVQVDAGFSEDRGGGDRQVNSSLDAVTHDDDVETVRAYSDDGHSYAGTIVRGVLRGDSE